MINYLLTVDLGGTRIRSALVAPGDRVLKEDHRPTGAAGGVQQVVDNLLDSLAAVTPTVALLDGSIVGIGVASPGPLDPVSGRIYFAPNLCWHDVNLKEILQQALGLPVWIENDANLAALGEYLYGAGQDQHDLVYITVSTGIGGGLIINGEIYNGALGGAGEIGHMVVAVDGPLCPCGNRGCLEAVASGVALGQQARELVAAGQGERILALVGGDPGKVDAPVVTAAARQDDPEAIELLATAGRYLGIAIGNAANLLNPSLFVIGGGLATGAGKLLLDPAVAEARLHTYPSFKKTLKIIPAELDQRAGLLGAAAYARRQLKG